jgi:hypothetical protein
MEKCKVEGCNTKRHALGLCRKHHARFIRHGSTDSKYDKEGYSKLGGVKDTRPGARGSLAVNLINDIKYKGMQRGKSWELTHKQAFELITATCTYCGYTPEWPKNRIGIDRVDNNKGYVPENCVPCCFDCNSAKKEKTLEEFIDWIKKVYNKLAA